MEGMELETGKILLEKYEIKRKLGEGTSGIVYLAHDRHLSRYVAIKKKKQDGNTEDKSFRQELVLLKELRHPMLPILYDYFWEDGWYLVMEYIQGESLHNYIDRMGSIEEKQALLWAIQIAELLHYLHDRKPAVIYRDLKPDNILVCPDGNLRLVDFGAAYCRQGAGGRDRILAGTMGYAAPEQLDGKNRKEGYSDERSDIYTFGATLYHMLTGHDPSLPPYGIRPIRNMNPELSSGMERFVERCTMVQPKMRFQTLEEIVKELERLKKHPNGLFWRRKGKYRSYSGKWPVMKRLERKIWLTQKQGSGLFGAWILLIGIFLSGFLFMTTQLSVIGKEKTQETDMENTNKLPLTIYNDLGQKILLQKGSVYRPQGSLILELEEESFTPEHLQMVSVSLTDCHTGMKQESVFYIRGR